MITIRFPTTAVAAALAALALGAGGCSKKTIDALRPNIPPEVRLTSAPISTATPVFYAYKMSWIGFDPDGRVDHFLYAIDPPLDGRPIPWVKTTKNEQIFFFRSTRPDSSRGFAQAIDFHVFAIRAVDNRGDSSQTVMRAFFSFTQAPTVNIISPRPSSLQKAFVTPAVRISWIGSDPDGQFTQKPIKYKYKLLHSGSEFPMDLALTRNGPDSLRRYYVNHPRGPWATWDSTSAETTQVQFTNLTPGVDYLFVVISFDEAGAYSPIFTLDSNMLRLRPGLAGSLGPQIRMFNEFFDFTYPGGGYTTDPRAEVFLEVPADEVVCFNWRALPPPGADIVSYRWALNIPDVSDETKRRNEETDVTRWSTPSLLTERACLGPFTEPREHRFYIEALDNNGLKSLGIVRFQVVRATFERPLLVVKDTRYAPDQVFAGSACPINPTGQWPTTAELDTFLFAVGNRPYRCYPANTLSQPGLFAGYSFDTLGTRIGQEEIGVRLAILGRYQRVVWITDALAATRSGSGTDPNDPTSSLRYMSSPGRVNTLAAYIKQGGKVWLAGGGAAYANLIPWDKLTNNTQLPVFSNDLGELVPGRMMYDLVHWRSEIRPASGTITIRRSPRALELNWPGMPTYSLMPADIRNKLAPPADPIPPLRTHGQFYPNLVTVEYLSLPNRILEDLNPDPDRELLAATLDTLYKATGLILPPEVFSGGRLVSQNPCMTYYHGLENEDLVFTGFDLWSYKRVDCQALVDFVLGRMWKLPKTAPAFAAQASIPPPSAARPTDRGAPSVRLPAGAARQAGAADGPPAFIPRE